MVSLAKSLESKWVSIKAQSSAQYFLVSRGFSAGLPWELLYADDLVIMADSLDELSVKLERWKAELSAKGLKVNTKKTKIMTLKPSRLDLDHNAPNASKEWKHWRKTFENFIAECGEDAPDKFCSIINCQC